MTKNEVMEPNGIALLLSPYKQKVLRRGQKYHLAEADMTAWNLIKQEMLALAYLLGAASDLSVAENLA